MALQVRVRHALGERLMELPDRTVESPVMVGRAGACEVQVPSVSVSPRHCAIFRHEGYWVVQDAGGTSGTFVNGEPVTEPVFLQVGDVISMGSETGAPTIEVDPAAAAEGRGGWAGDQAAATATAVDAGGAAGYGHAPVRSPQGGASASARYAAPGVHAAPGYPAVPSDAGVGYTAPDAGWPGAEDDGLAALAATSAAPAAGPGAAWSSPARARKPQSSPTALVVGILIAAVIVGITAWVVYSKLQTPPTTIVQKTQNVPAPPKDRSNNIFGIGDGSADAGGSSASSGSPNPGRPAGSAAWTPKATPPGSGLTSNPDGEPVMGKASPTSKTPPATPKATTPQASPSPGDSGTAVAPKTPVVAKPPKSPPPDSSAGQPDAPEKADKPDMTEAAAPPPKPEPVVSRSDDPAWDAVETAQGNPALDLFKMLDYQRTYPDKHADELATLMDKRLDRVWWERIGQLFAKRDRLNSDIAKKQRELFDENNPEEKKKGLDQLKQWQKDLTKVSEVLRDTMSYDRDQPPSLDDKSQLAQLAEARNAAKYEAWKKATLHYIRDNKGHLAWDGDQ